MLTASERSRHRAFQAGILDGLDPTRLSGALGDMVAAGRLGRGQARVFAAEASDLLQRILRANDHAHGIGPRRPVELAVELAELP